MNNKLKNLVNQISGQYFNILNIKPEKTNLQILDKKEWNDFCSKYNFDRTKEGILLPRNLTAYLLEDSDYLDLNLFHEYFGHGLYCEYSKIGKSVVELERRLMKEEEEFFRKDFSFEELKEFRRNNETFKLLQQATEKNLGLYEIFAIWTEHYLSEIQGIGYKFDEKYKEMPLDIKMQLEKILEFQQDYRDTYLFKKLEII